MRANSRGCHGTTIKKCASGNIRDIEVRGDYAYVADLHGGLQVIDVSNPFAPYVVAVLPVPESSWGIAVSGDLAYSAQSANNYQRMPHIVPMSSVKQVIPRMWLPEAIMGKPKLVGSFQGPYTR